MKIISDKICRENQTTHFIFNKVFFFFENRAIYQIMLKNIVEAGRAQMAIWAMCIVSGSVRLHIHTQIMQYVLRATTTMVARTRLNVTFYSHSPRFLPSVTEISAIVLLL